MLQKVRAHLSYANVMASIAVFIALGGGAYAAVIAPKNSVVSRSIKNGQVKRQDLGSGAVTNTRIGRKAVSNSKIGPNAISNSKLRDASVSSSKIADGSVTTSKLGDNSVTTAKLADSAVTSSKLAANSVSGLTQITDGTVTGADVLENTLKFGCSGILTVQPPNQGPYSVGTDGFCAFVIRSAGSQTWNQAANDCTGFVADSTLATPAEIEQLQATNGGAQGPVTGETNMWSSAPSATTSVWTVHVGNGGTVSDFAQVAIGTANPAPIVCVYQPASKNG
jgi:hypothetical protein